MPRFDATTNPNAIPVTYDGFDYPSISALARAYHVTPKTAKKRLEDGLPMHAETRGRTQMPLRYNGLPYASIRELADAHGVNYDRLKYALKRNDTETALRYAAEPVRASGRAVPVTYLGVDYPSMEDLATHYGLSYKAVRYRLDNNVPLDTPVESGSPRHPVTVFGVTYPSKASLARAFRISPQTLQSRLRAGDTLEDAVRRPHSMRYDDDMTPLAPVTSTGNRKTTPISVGDVTYPSKAAFARAIGTSKQVVNDRLNRGQSPEAIFAHFTERQTLARKERDV